MSLDLRWASVFADVPAPRMADALAFWAAVTGTAPGQPAGSRDEFVPLVPAEGDGYLWLQRVDREIGGWHLDLHVPDPQGAARAAVAGGARMVHSSASLLVLESPAGQPFCLVRDARPVRRRPAPPRWPVGGRSLVDQLCLDMPHDDYDAECEFWAALTGWQYVPEGAPEFRRLNPPPELPVQLLLQRLGADDTGGIRAHLDMSADDPPAEVARHLSLGADIVHEAQHWTVLHDPVGLTYCVTHRRPWQPPD